MYMYYVLCSIVNTPIFASLFYNSSIYLLACNRYITIILYFLPNYNIMYYLMNYIVNQIVIQPFYIKSKSINATIAHDCCYFNVIELVVKLILCRLCTTLVHQLQA